MFGWRELRRWWPGILMLWTGLAVGADRHAILVGVGSYAHPSIPRLPGAVLDIRRMQHVLEREFGFASDHVEVLIDERATLAEIRNALGQLRQRSQPGDLVVIAFSGHGTSIPDDNGDEAGVDPADQRDEALVPFDATLDGQQVLRDDELGALLDGVLAGEMVVLLDTCFSGTATKSQGGRLATVRSPSFAPIPAREPSGSARWPTASGFESEFASRAPSPAGVPRRIVFSACEADQTAREILLSHSVPELRVGAFSHLFLEGLRNAADSTGDGVVSYGELFRHINRRLDELINQAEPSRALRQHARVEYSSAELADEPVFALRERQPDFLRVVTTSGQRVKLDGGAIQGLELGQTWGLFRSPREIGNSNQAAATLRIVSVTLEEAWGETAGGPPVSSSFVAAPLVSTLGTADLFLRSEVARPARPVSVPLADRIKRRIDQNLRDIPGVRTGIVAGYDVRLTFLDTVAADGATPIITVELRDARDILWRTITWEPTAPSVDAQGDEIDAHIWKPLQASLTELRLRNMWAQLHNPRPSLQLQLVMDRAPQGDGDVPDYRLGDAVKFGLKTSADCWYVLVAIDPAGQAQLLTSQPQFAPAGKKLLFPGPGSSLKVATREGIYVVKLVAFRQLPGNELSSGKVPDLQDIFAMPLNDWNATSTTFRVNR